MDNIKTYIEERIEALREKMNKEQNEYGKYTIEYMDSLCRYNELQAVLSKIKELG